MPDQPAPSIHEMLFLRARKALAEQRPQEAIALCRELLSLDPSRAEAHHLLGMALVNLGSLEEALLHLGTAVNLQPEEVIFRRSLGGAWCQSGQFEKGEIEFEAWNRLAPNEANAWNELGRVRHALSKLDLALEAFGRTVELAPGNVSAWMSMGSILKDLGRIEEALAAFRQAESLSPDHPGIGSSRLYALHFLPGITDETLVKEHAQWRSTFGVPLGDTTFQHLVRDPHRRLTVGFVSPDFLDHCQAYFTLPLLANLDRNQFKIICYSNVQSPDEVTSEFHRIVDAWRDISQKSDPQAEAMIRSDRVDILIDLTLHMDGNRLPLFARKPAPVQISYLGYPSTTGLETMDYRITDPYLDPPDLPGRPFLELPLHLPKTYWCYRPPQQAQLEPRSPSGSGEIRFASFNNPSKINALTLELWNSVLLETPESTLKILAEGESHRGKIRQALSQKGVAETRISFMDRMPPEAYYQAFKPIDILLDTFPVNGHTTTLDALWMGVPVVSLAGLGGLSRGGMSILMNLGLPELVADTPEDFVKAAVSLAQDTQRLNQLQGSLRSRMLGSPLMDEATFARDFSVLLRQAWEVRCLSRIAGGREGIQA